MMNYKIIYEQSRRRERGRCVFTHANFIKFPGAYVQSVLPTVSQSDRRNHRVVTYSER